MDTPDNNTNSNDSNDLDGNVGVTEGNDNDNNSNNNNKNDKVKEKFDDDYNNDGGEEVELMKPLQHQHQGKTKQQQLHYPIPNYYHRPIRRKVIYAFPFTRTNLTAIPAASPTKKYNPSPVVIPIYSKTNTIVEDFTEQPAEEETATTNEIIIRPTCPYNNIDELEQNYKQNAFAFIVSVLLTILFYATIVGLVAVISYVLWYLCDYWFYNNSPFAANTTSTEASDTPSNSTYKFPILHGQS